MTYPYGATGFKYGERPSATLRRVGFFTKKTGEWVQQHIDDVAALAAYSGGVVVANNDVTFLLVAYDGYETCNVFLSTDSGETWEEQVHDLAMPGPGDIVFARFVGGYWCLLYNDGYGNIRLYKSLDGLVWEYEAVGSGYEDCYGPSCQTHVAVSGSTIHVAAAAQDLSAIYYFYSTDLGLTWSEPEVVVTPSGDFAANYGIVAYQDIVIVACLGWGNSVHQAISLDAGITWDSESYGMSFGFPSWNFYIETYPSLALAIIDGDLYMPVSIDKYPSGVTPYAAYILKAENWATELPDWAVDVSCNQSVFASTVDMAAAHAEEEGNSVFFLMGLIRLVDQSTYWEQRERSVAELSLLGSTDTAYEMDYFQDYAWGDYLYPGGSGEYATGDTSAYVAFYVGGPSVSVYFF